MKLNFFKHKHAWKLSHTTWETVGHSTSGTTTWEKEYAYLLCQCGKVKKVEVEK